MARHTWAVLLVLGCGTSEPPAETCPPSVAELGTCTRPLTCGYADFCGLGTTATCDVSRRTFVIERSNCPWPEPPSKAPECNSASVGEPCKTGDGPCVKSCGSGSAKLVCVGGKWDVVHC